MRLVHLAPFAPNRAGIYEAARDMARADSLAGHGAEFVDAGVSVGGRREEPQIGACDDRGDFRLVTSPPRCLDWADLLVCHTGIPDAWVARTQAPMVWIIHGRPLAAFRPEQNGGPVSYSLYAAVAEWPRTKALVHFWPEFDPYWSAIIPAEKLHAIDWPVIDEVRFAADGDVHEFGPHRGEINGLICDSWREDIDTFEVATGALIASRCTPGLRWHFYAMESPLAPCWERLLAAFRAIGALGEVCGRMPAMERVYRAADFVLTPHRIITRVIGEALSTGTPVVASRGCRVTPYTADPQDPWNIAEVVTRLVTHLRHDRTAIRTATRIAAERFAAMPYAAAMTGIYERALTGRPSRGALSEKGAHTWS